MRKTSWGLMVLPVIGLAAYGLLASRPKVSRPPGLFIEKLELVPVTAREASQGYAGKARVVLGYAGARPKWWGQPVNTISLVDPLTYGKSGHYETARWRVGAALVRREGTRRTTFGSSEDRQIDFRFMQWVQPHRWDAGHYEIETRYRLDGIARGPLPVRLLLGVADGARPLTIREAIVRDGPGAPAPPDFPRDSGINILGSHVTMLTPARSHSMMDGDCQVDVDVRFDGSADPIPWNLDDEACVVDSSGKQWREFPIDANSFTGFRTESPKVIWPGKDHRITWTFYSERLPRGPLVFKAGVGLGDGWIEPIRVVIRTGKEKPPHLLQATTQILGTQVRPANPDERAIGEDTAVTVSFRAKRGAPTAKQWSCDYSQHLMDSKGMVQWGVDGGPRPQWYAARKCWQYSYAFKRTAYLPGKLKFAAKIGLPGEEMVPVECLVEKQ